MSLDIAYRPKTYSEVVGQQGVIRMLREIVKSGRGFHQSYLFAGPHGSSKTTNARIFARSILCKSPIDGEGCGQCESCKSFDEGKSLDFVEIDAATNSGKSDMKRIVESLRFSSFSGDRTLYLFDEAHQLTKDALDAILKPMEDPIPGSAEKQLVCIFCTTEPEKMRSTILSRCAPAFAIRKPDVPDIVERLKYVCQQEGIPYEEPALTALTEITKSHMRDALKSLDGISLMPNGASMDNVTSYLQVGSQGKYADVLVNIGEDLQTSLTTLRAILETTSPTVAYEKLLEMCMVAHRVSVGITQIPSFWNYEQITRITSKHGDFILQIAERLAKQPGKPTASMLECDIGILHLMRKGAFSAQVPMLMSVSGQNQIPSKPAKSYSQLESSQTKEDISSVDFGQADQVFVPPKATRRYFGNAQPEETPLVIGDQLHPSRFFELLAKRFQELRSVHHEKRIRILDRS